jgi:hypothetical protein
MCVWPRGAKKREQNLVVKHEGKNLLENLGVDGMIILKWILRKQDRRV